MQSFSFADRKINLPTDCMLTLYSSFTNSAAGENLMYENVTMYEIWLHPSHQQQDFFRCNSNHQRSAP